ncbi:hypothetical protein BC834DRAFT_924461 [Gloeopeniophorella convolvens]|nr:hypothetical protein BC834DRAFT_924461 [Gloeopeniophorella convolvens]
MTETKGPANKLAMSRALGAAFLTHQVEQLEKSVAEPRAWRDRPRAHPTEKRSGAQQQQRLPVGGIRFTTAATRKRGEETAQRKAVPAKDADVVIVDASVLVNALGQVRKWCRDGQEEIIIVPLEALNTLDLLKKGSTPLAQRARAASRVLESQVGANPRVRVQQDTAFVLWDAIAFADADGGTAAALQPSPEWVRRTICCAQWETTHADPARPRVVLATLAPPPAPQSAPPVPPPANKHELRAAGALVAHWARRAGLAVLAVPSSADTPHGRTSPDERRAPPPQFQSRGKGGAGKGPGAGGMVERPPAVRTMMEVVAQPSRVVRVLARGEKLDP